MHTQADRRGESGHLMAGLMVIVAILMIASAVAFQEIGDKTRRENEAEMMFRAQDFARALYRFEKANGRLPTSMEEFLRAGPSGQYFLRQVWEDPLVTDGKWGMLFVGPGGAVFDPSSTTGIAGLTGPGGEPIASGSPLEGSLANQSSFSNGTSSAFGNDNGESALAGRDARGQRGKPGARNEGGLGSRSRLNSGEQAGGLPIAGVKSLSTDSPFRIYNGLTEYSQWLFTVQDLKQQRQKTPGGQKRRRPAATGGTNQGSGFTPKPQLN